MKKKYTYIAIFLTIFLFIDSYAVQKEKTVYTGDDYYFIHELERANQFLDADDYKKAVEIFENIYLYFSNRDREPEVLYNYGKALFKEGNFEEATRILKKLDEKYDDYEYKDEVLKILEALNEAPETEVGDTEEIIVYPKALIAIEEANKKANANADKYEKLEVAKFRFNNGEYKQAIELFKQIEGFFEGKSQMEDIYYMIGQSYYELKDVESALQYFKKYQKLFSFGKYQRQVNGIMDSLDEIQDTFSQVTLASDYREIDLKKIDELVEAGFVDMAINKMRKLIDLQPKNPVYHFKIASLYNLKKKMTGQKYWTVNYAEDELRHYQKILERVETPEIFYNIAKLYQDLGEYEKAKEYWRKVQKTSPDSTIGKVAKSFLEK